MCRINTRGNIVSQGDINSLVVGVINRQQTPFSEAMVKDMVLHLSAGAKIDIIMSEIENLIKARLDTLVRNDFVSYKRGQYYPRNIVNKL